MNRQKTWNWGSNFFNLAWKEEEKEKVQKVEKGLFFWKNGPKLVY